MDAMNEARKLAAFVAREPSKFRWESIRLLTLVGCLLLFAALLAVARHLGFALLRLPSWHGQLLRCSEACYCDEASRLSSSAFFSGPR